MQEVALEYYTFTTNDLTPVILKLKNANPDILHHIARNQDAILFWRQAREQNFEFKAVVHAGATGYGSPDFGKAFGNDANGPFALARARPGPDHREAAARRAADRARVPRGGEGQDRLGRPHAAGTSSPGAACGCSSWCSTRRRPTTSTSSAPRSWRWTCRSAADQRLGREVRRERPEHQRARAALHAPVAERPARHGVAGGAHDQPRQVDSARRVGPAQIALSAGHCRIASIKMPDPVLTQAVRDIIRLHKEIAMSPLHILTSCYQVISSNFRSCTHSQLVVSTILLGGIYALSRWGSR